MAPKDADYTLRHNQHPEARLIQSYMSTLTEEMSSPEIHTFHSAPSDSQRDNKSRLVRRRLPRAYKKKE